MDFTDSYCQIRRDLEKRGRILTSRYATLTSRLLQLIGHDHKMFLDMQNNCRTIALKITAARSDLQEHRRDHGC